MATFSLRSMNRVSSRSRQKRLDEIGSVAGHCHAPLPGHALHEGGGRDDRNFPERIEREQIGVAGDDQIGMAADGQLEEFVILRIAAGSYPLGDGDLLAAGGREIRTL